MRAPLIVLVKSVALAATFFLVLGSCQGFDSLFGGGKTHKGARRKGTPAVCIRADTPVRRVSGEHGDPVAALALGETVFLTGELDTSAGRSSVEVQLTDEGTSGWVPTSAIVPDARAGALKRQVRIYRRPDSITVTEKRFQFMDMVALTDSTGPWAEVMGERRMRQGWIRADALALDKDDVASAIFARRKLREMSGSPRKEVLDWIILNAPFTESYFVEQLRNMSALEELFDTLETEREPRADPTADSKGFF